MTDSLEEAADRVAELLRQAEAAEAAGRDSTALQQQAFEIAASALQADPPWQARSRRLDGESDEVTVWHEVTVWDDRRHPSGTDGD